MVQITGADQIAVVMPPPVTTAIQTALGTAKAQLLVTTAITFIASASDGVQWDFKIDVRAVKVS
jgi:hypothetical protein